MKAFVYRGPGLKAIEDRPKPDIQAPGDAIVKMVKTTLCGTDLHNLKGDVATCAPGRILGHEGVGVVDSVGARVTAFRPGDRVLISCISSCGAHGRPRCRYGDRSRRRAGDLRALTGPDWSRRGHRQHRRARPEGRSSPRTAVVEEHRDHDPPGRYGHDAGALENRAIQEDRSEPSDHASLQVGSDPRRLRHFRARR